MTYTPPALHANDTLQCEAPGTFGNNETLVIIPTQSIGDVEKYHMNGKFIACYKL